MALFSFTLLQLHIHNKKILWLCHGIVVLSDGNTTVLDI